MNNCIICGKETPHIVIFRHTKDYECGVPCADHGVIKCSVCGLVSLDPMPSMEQLQRYYPADYNPHVDGQTSRIRQLLEWAYGVSQINMIRRLIGEEGNILDVGCSTGKLIGLLEKTGKWICHGIEFKDEAAEAGRKHGRKIFTGTIETVDLKEDFYDLIMLNHMIEHSTDPGLLLCKACGALKRNGKILVETPNAAALDFKIFGDKWGCLHYPRHTYIFSKDNMGILMERGGFRVNGLDYSIHTCGWALGCQHMLTNRYRVRKESGRISIYPLLLSLFIPITMLQKFLGNGSIMVVVGSKK